jgi:MbtH protein
MNKPPDPPTRTYQVVVNDEDQYSVWFADASIPLGWRAVGVQGPKDVCLAHIESIWKDMRPKSLRID